ncbi:MAG: citrate synthase [Gammaproteobacteria bacterium]|nr:citrate synthase [Gammaproteobacteria bacterium]
MSHCNAITDVVANISDSIAESTAMDSQLFDSYQVKKGLRNKDFTGVLVGLTNIGEVVGYEREGDKITPVDGHLYYRGIDLHEIAENLEASSRFGFDEVVYLLLTGRQPTKSELTCFECFLSEHRELPNDVVNNLILSLSGKNIMNMLARTVLGLYTLDDKADDISPQNLTEQSLNLIAKFPEIIAYAYHGMRHNHEHEPLVIRHPRKELSTAENFLYLLKGEDYTRLEAEILDLSLILHAEHGGGNNSTFTIRVTSSSGTDTYSAIASALSSLNGPLHGGANLKAQNMMEHLMENIKNWDDDEEVKDYLKRILKKEAYDGTGKIYGMGHAIYTLSDPRSVLLKRKAKQLSIEKGREAEYALYESVERLTPEVFKEIKGPNAKALCANVDLYSGFVYSSIGVPKELYTPLFAMARVAGWCAHRIEELNFVAKRIIRPAYKGVFDRREYIPLSER